MWIMSRKFLGPLMHILMTVNAAWNVWNFRRPLVEALIADGHGITILAPLDDAWPISSGLVAGSFRSR